MRRCALARFRCLRSLARSSSLFLWPTTFHTRVFARAHRLRESLLPSTGRPADSHAKTPIHYATPRSINEHSRVESTRESWEAPPAAYIGYITRGGSPVFAAEPAPRSCLLIRRDCAMECRAGDLRQLLPLSLSLSCSRIFASPRILGPHSFSREPLRHSNESGHHRRTPIVVIVSDRDVSRKRSRESVRAGPEIDRPRRDGDRKMIAA